MVAAIHSNSRLLVGACGSSAIVNLPAYLAVFRSRLDAEVRVVLTSHAAQFLPAHTVALFCDEVLTSAEGLGLDRNHVELARWADGFVVLPATANVLASAAHGCADTLLTATALAYERPITFFPVMNAAMWTKPPVRRNVETLRADGHVVVEPTVSRNYVAASKSFEVTGGLTTPTRLLRTVSELLRPLTAASPNQPSKTDTTAQ